MGKKEIKKVVFYYTIDRFLRTTLISHLYEIAQIYPVILLAEELDNELEEILRDKKLFPKLDKTIFIYQHSGPKRNIFKKNYHLRNLAKKIIYYYKPDIVIAPNDLYLFEMYLMKFAKKINALTISLQAANVTPSDQVREQVDLVNAYIRFPRFLPLFFRFFLVQCRKYIGHIFYYWILPMMVGEKPFFGKSSYILRKGTLGMREADYQIVFSERDYDIFLGDGVSSEKVYILSHPLKREKTRKFFEKFLLDKIYYQNEQKIATLLIPADEIGFRKKDYSLISEKERLKERIDIVKTMAERLGGWKIFIKPHPNVLDFLKTKQLFEFISDSVKVIEPSESADKYINKSKIVIGLPKSMSTVLFIASLLSPQKIIISLDFDKELLGDFYKDYEGIEYIDNKEKFIEMLNLIKNNKFIKRYKMEEKRQNPKEFMNFIELINSLVLKNYESKK